LMVVLNQVSDDHIGQEFAGVVIETNTNPTHGYRVGDRVCGFANGTFCSQLTTKASHLLAIPSWMSFAEASAIPVAYGTAQYGLMHLGRLQPGESLLIHAAAGAVGQAAIRIAQRVGAVVYVTVSSAEKKRLLVDRYGIDPSHFFNSRQLAFAQEILQKTAGRGVDVVLNSLSGQALAETWRCIAPFGRFIEIGKRDMVTFKSLPMDPFQRNVSFCSLDLSVVSKLNDRLTEQVFQEVQALIAEQTAEQRSLTAHPLTVFKVSEYEQAFRFLQTGQHAGKAVVDWEQPDTIQVRFCAVYDRYNVIKLTYRGIGDTKLYPGLQV
jgi:NADPH:quinone reductase-like Zn-dependent oxidoreductase